MSASRSGSPTTCCPATAPARSWPSPPTTSATSRSPAATTCRSATSWRRPARTWTATPPSWPTPPTRCCSTPASSPACRPPRRSAPSPRAWRSAAWARRRSPTASATGWSAASATGARRSRSSTAPSTARSRCPRIGAAGAAAAGRRVPARRRVPAAAHHRIVPGGDLPGMRRARAARDGHHGHLRRLGLVFPALLLAARRTTWHGDAEDVAALDADGPVHRRRGARRHAPAVLPLLGQGAARHRAARFRRADPRAAQPGPDPGRRPPAHEQVARQRARTRTS